MKKRNTRKQKGGEILGEGRYGIVVWPGIPCKKPNLDPRTYVSKVFYAYKNLKNKRNYEEHKKIIEISNKLKEIDEQQDYFIYPVFCEEFGELSDDNKKNGVQEHQKAFSYMLKKAGKTMMETHRKKLREATFFPSKTYEINGKEFEKRKQAGESYEKITEDMKAKLAEKLRPEAEKLIEDLRTIIEPVFPIIERLHAAGIVHGDLHPGNIVYGEDGKPRLIDFDMAKFSEKKGDFNLEKITFILNIIPGWMDSFPDLFDKLTEGFMEKMN